MESMSASDQRDGVSLNKPSGRRVEEKELVSAAARAATAALRISHLASFKPAQGSRKRACVNLGDSTDSGFEAKAAGLTVTGKRKAKKSISPPPPPPSAKTNAARNGARVKDEDKDSAGEDKKVSIARFVDAGGGSGGGGASKDCRRSARLPDSSAPAALVPTVSSSSSVPTLPPPKLSSIVVPLPAEDDSAVASVAALLLSSVGVPAAHVKVNEAPSVVAAAEGDLLKLCDGPKCSCHTHSTRPLLLIDATGLVKAQFCSGAVAARQLQLNQVPNGNEGEPKHTRGVFLTSTTNYHNNNHTLKVSLTLVLMLPPLNSFPAPFLIFL